MKTSILVHTLAISVMFATYALAEKQGKSPAQASEPLGDCLLPGKPQKLGDNFTYLGQRRIVKTTAQGCLERGGEYRTSSETTPKQLVGTVIR